MKGLRPRGYPPARILTAVAILHSLVDTYLKTPPSTKMTGEPKAVPMEEFPAHKTEPGFPSPAPPPPSPTDKTDDADKFVSSPREVDGSQTFQKRNSLHHLLGGGKPADAFLWRNKKASAGVLGGATAIWAFFEVLQYHLLPLLCYTSMLVVSLLFLWSNAHIFIYKSPPHLPEVRIKEEPFLQVASAIRIEINRAIAMLRDIASGRDVKKFIAVVVGLWVLSVVGKWCNFLTLFYMVVVLLHTVPVVYGKYQSKIDTFAERIFVESKKKYAIFNEKVMSKIPKGTLKDKKKE